ncbi:MAG: ybgF [Gammaproteobacteria bacterium]|jgi:tol-pal system protein YbgF|nr:ybgF [Gammaproteobacteria bacterium]
MKNIRHLIVTLSNSPLPRSGRGQAASAARERAPRSGISFFAILIASLCITTTVLAQAPVLNAMADSAAPAQQYTDSTTPQNTSNPAAPVLTGQAALLNEITQLQQEVRQLRGLIEIQQHDIQSLQKQQLTLYSDLDQRLSAAGSQPGSVPAVQTAAGLTTETGAAGIAVTEDFTAKMPSAAKSSKIKADPKEEQAYQAAYQWVLAKRYTEAISALQQFLKDYPNSLYQPNTHYWLGQVYLIQDDLTHASTEFSDLLTQYPTDPKASSALFKLGYIDVINQDYASAKRRFDEVKTRYPNTESAKAADDKLTELKRAGYL